MSRIDELVRHLGVTAAPLVLAGIAKADSFFRVHVNADPLEWLDYLRGIDFHKQVAETWLKAGQRLIRHASTNPGRPKPFVYFADPGASPTRLGTTFPSTRFEEYAVTDPIRALESYASSLSFGRDPRTGDFDRTSRVGGGRQYIVANRDTRGLKRVR
jgi:hypothetical protein